ncbi:MAG: hypothetical protein ACAH12_03635 [Methylophilaceae bacterium]
MFGFSMNWKIYIAIGLIVTSAAGGFISGKRWEHVNTLQAQNDLRDFQDVVAKGVTDLAILRLSQQAASAKSNAEQLADFSAAFLKLKGKYDAKLNIAVSDADSLRRQASDYRRSLGEILISTRRLTESGGDCDTELANRKQYQETIEAACIMTTIDYNYLRTSWDKECEIKGCE